MTTQEQLEKIIEFYVGSLIPDRHKKDLASAIHSAMRIDEVKLEKELLEELRFLKVKEENFNIMPSDIVFQRVAKAVASHAQEIIKFEEE